ncbi:UNVERIFIED_CONTAM: GTP-binding protein BRASSINAZOLE INSENSITIVE PALE GREEN 2, chloroplastic [Sesamum radiatum]|uniref:GTP-binding protein BRASSINAZOLE INSENSITIVE PALE GREEN 2, chloroplastic n=1 Tax=Sesamum radiatum TaxID=300843 RepID=A0AAW2W465_SESRA
MVVRNLSLSTLKKLLTSLSLSAYTYRGHVSNCVHSLMVDPSTSTASSSCQNPAKILPFLFLASPFSSQTVNQSFSVLPLARDGNYEEANDHALPICPGCGIHMQHLDRKQPGFFVSPENKGPKYKKLKKMTPVLDESEITDSLKKGLLNEIAGIKTRENFETEDQVFDERPKDVENVGSQDEKTASEKPLVCSRCHNLRHYGKVVDEIAENLLPDFDFDHTVGRRLTSISGARTVVLLVVDATDFDGSFPRKVANLVSKTIDENAQSWKEGKSGNIPRVLLVVTKIDLLPGNISPTGLEHWVRTRARRVGQGN